MSKQRIEIEVDVPKLKTLGYDLIAVRVPTREDPIYMDNPGGCISQKRSYDINWPCLILRRVEPKKHTLTYWLAHFYKDDRDGTLPLYATCHGSREVAECSAKELPSYSVAITGPHEITFTEGDGLQREGE